VALALRHPDIGEMIGDYKVVGLLGAGGLGVVYKVERGGRFFALKLLLLSQLDGRARREIGILIHLENPYVVRYVGSDFWPDPAIGHPYIVMEYVPGDTLWTFAYKENPSARKATRLILDTALTLGEVHAAGVFHRDVKPENILIHSGSERPILIDFGIGSLAGAPPVTGSVLPPGTEEFRSPEQIRFRRANSNGTAHFEYGPADELWALGVTYYWLLTDVLPFGERTDEGGLDGLRERILTRRPIAPHLINPRVPLAASLLCMKMLAERPEERFPGVAPLCAALNEALSNAENDAVWDVSLVDPYDPQTTTTVEEPAKGEPNEALRTFLRLAKRRPRRGLPLPNRAPVLFLPEQRADPRPAAAEQDPSRKVEAPRVEPAAGEQEQPVKSAPVPPVREQLDPPVTHDPRPAAWRLGLVAAVVAGVAVVLSVSADLWGPGSSTHATEVQPSTFAAPHATDGGGIGREVALAAKPLESPPGGDAAPEGAQPPASTAKAMTRTSAQTTKTETTKSQPQRSGSTLPVKPAVAVIAACSLLDGGCTASTAQVRPEPPTVDCPEGWKEAHARLGIDASERGSVVVQGYEGAPGERATVKEGPVTVWASFGMGLPRGTLLKGKLKLGESRYFATFTEAQLPGGEKTYPVCVALYADIPIAMGDNEPNCPPGLGQCPYSGSKPSAIKVFPRWEVYAAGYFF
jgi:serine/threonine-protein kinase